MKENKELIIEQATAPADKFVGLQTEDFQNIYKIYCDKLLAKNSLSDIKIEISSFLHDTYGYTENEASLITKTLVQQFSSPDFHTQFYDSPITVDMLNKEVNKNLTPQISISLLDYQRYVELINADPDADNTIKILLLSFVIFYRKNYHPRGWSRYDKKSIFHLAGINKLPVYTQEKLTNYLHTHYNLNMQVVGSNQPTPCFNFQWLYDQPEINDETNPMINLGPLKPSTLVEIVKKIKA